MVNGSAIQKNDALYGQCKRDIAETLRVSGINPTSQRIEIGHLLFRRPQHLSAEEIFHRINQEYEQVSQATVYNTLRLFVEKGVVRELIFSPDRIYYDSNTTPHHHFIDVDTSIVYDIPIDSLETPRMEGLDAEILDVTLMIRGRLKRPN